MAIISRDGIRLDWLQFIGLAVIVLIIILLIYKMFIWNYQIVKKTHPENMTNKTTPVK